MIKRYIFNKISDIISEEYKDNNDVEFICHAGEKYRMKYNMFDSWYHKYLANTDIYYDHLYEKYGSAIELMNDNRRIDFVNGKWKYRPIIKFNDGYFLFEGNAAMRKAESILKKKMGDITLICTIEYDNESQMVYSITLERYDKLEDKLIEVQKEIFKEK